ncbi:MAG: UDP-3-O-acyl-N-acetylglucosamine deacetylase [Bacteroidales bacterium]|nr:UDP-3-O-acyl-N-acetylglucosamine deacetylase [Bacteroidales bacterium]
MAERQRTIAQKVSFSGKGLHTGKTVTATVYPAEPNTGINFKRIDIEGVPVIPAIAENVVDTARGTVIGVNGVVVSTIEHLMASFHSLHVNNAVIEVDGPEVPILNGSAKPFFDEIQKVGTVEQDADVEYLEVKEKTTYVEPERGVEIIAYPCDTFRLDVKISYDSFMLRHQYASLNDLKDFGTEIACCKTFCFLREIEMMLAANLIKGGDLDNALVFVDRPVSQEEVARLAALFNKTGLEVKKEGLLNNTPMSFENEPARHKLLDLIGDLWLVGKPIKAHVIATIPGHKANTEFAKILRKQIK